MTTEQQLLVSIQQLHTIRVTTKDILWHLLKIYDKLWKNHTQALPATARAQEYHKHRTGLQIQCFVMSSSKLWKHLPTAQ
jgi:hypothetical protein